MKKYFYIFLGGKRYRVEIDEELDKLLRKTLKDNYQFEDNILKLNISDNTKNYQLKTKMIKNMLNLINTYELDPELAKKVAYLKQQLSINKTTVYDSDLRKLEELFNEVTNIYGTVRTTLIKKDQAKIIEEQNAALEEAINDKFSEVITDSSSNTDHNIEDIKKILNELQEDPDFANLISYEQINEAIDNIVICKTMDEYLELSSKDNNSIENANFNKEKIIIPPNTSLKEIITKLVKSSYFQDSNNINTNINTFDDELRNALDIFKENISINFNSTNLNYYSKKFMLKYKELCRKYNRDPEAIFKEFFKGQNGILKDFFRHLNIKSSNASALVLNSLINEGVNSKLINKSYFDKISSNGVVNRGGIDLESTTSSDYTSKNTSNYNSTINQGITSTNTSSLTSKEEVSANQKDSATYNLNTDLASLNRTSNLNNPKTNLNVAPNNLKGVKASPNFNNVVDPSKEELALNIHSKAKIKAQKVSASTSTTHTFKRNNGFNQALLFNAANVENEADVAISSDNDLMENEASSTDLPEYLNNEPLNDEVSSNNVLSNPLDDIEDTSNTSNNNSNDPSKRIFNNKKKLLLIGGGAVAFIFLILICCAGGDASFNGNNQIGLSGYQYFELNKFCETVTVYNPKDNTYSRQVDFETEYIPGVLNKEVGEFTDAPELLKAFAIQIRDFALHEINYGNTNCVLEGSSRFQNFTFDEEELKKVTNPDHPLAQAAAQTYGLIGVKDGKVARGDYDMACYRSQDENNYYLEYGGYTIGEKKLQPVPKTWDYSYLKRLDHCAGHGNGASQVGAYYLAKVQNYSYLDILKYYNGDNFELNSIYESATNNTNFTEATSSGTNGIINIALRDFLKSKGSSVEEFNEYLLKNVVNAGIGTREAAITFAVSLIDGLYKNFDGARLPYTLCGLKGCNDMYNSQGINVNRTSKSFYGVDPNWGTKITNPDYDPNAYNYPYHGGWTSYNYYGPECAGFVSYILHNAGFDAPYTDSGGMGNLGPKKELNGQAIGKPGDLLWHSGHVMFIVGVDEASKVYYIAHASGGSNGTLISTVSFTNGKTINYVIDMEEWYQTHKLNITTEEFIARYRAGYVL